MRFTRKFWFWALVQGCVVAAMLGWRFYAGASAYLDRPSDGDLYAQNWSFQAMAFAVVAGPWVLCGMSALLAVEWFIVRFISKSQVVDEGPLA